MASVVVVGETQIQRRIRVYDRNVTFWLLQTLNFLRSKDMSFFWVVKVTYPGYSSKRIKTLSIGILMEDIFLFGDGDSDFKGEDRELFSFHSISKVCNGMVNTSFNLIQHYYSFKGAIQLCYRVGHLRVLLGIGTLFNPVQTEKRCPFQFGP